MTIPNLLDVLPTKSLRLPVGVTPNNDPQVVYDGSQWVMFHSTPSGSGQCYFRTAPTQDGPWSGSTQFNSSHSKPYVLVDGSGTPVQIGGKYHCFAIDSFSIVRMTASTLTGSWTDTGTELAHNPSVLQQPDGFGMLAVAARYIGGVVYLLYMGLPGINGVSGSDATYGFASRGCYATASAPGGVYVRGGAFLNPSTTNTDWDYGWIGGWDIYLNNDGVTYTAPYNAGITRPATSGDEPSFGHNSGGPGRIGAATLTGLPGVGVLTKYVGNPILIPDNPDTGDPEYGNTWRIQCSWDGTRWRWWYNTGPYGFEHITYAASPSVPSLWGTPFSDNFNRANGAPGNGWTDVGVTAYAISSNKLVLPNTGSSAVEILYQPGLVFTTDQRVKMTILALAANEKVFIDLRMAGPLVSGGSFYFGAISLSSATVVAITKVVAGANTGLGNGTLSSNLTSGHDYRLEVACRSTNPTLLCASVFDITAGTWLIQNFQPSVTDAEATLQPANPSGIMCQNNVSSKTATLVTIETGFFLVPVAAFSGTPLIGLAPRSVTFTDASTNTPASWLWEKSSDGVSWSNFSGTPTAQNPVEIFGGGTWSIRLTATNSAGSNQLVKSNYLTITPSSSGGKYTLLLGVG